MDQKICLDTDAVIAILNAEQRVLPFFDQIDDADVYISAVTLFELLLRETNLDQIDTFCNSVRVLEFTEPASRIASRIFKDLRKKGQTRDTHDIFIAATCITFQCALFTFNKKDFQQIDHLRLL